MAPAIDPAAVRAAKLSRIPGVTLAEACQRFGVSKAAVTRARRSVTLSLPELALAAVTRNGTAAEGTLDLAGLARWIDHVNHDGCSEAEVRALLEPFVASGQLAIDGHAWRLQVAWP